MYPNPHQIPLGSSKDHEKLHAEAEGMCHVLGLLVCTAAGAFFQLSAVSLYRSGRSVIILETSIPPFHLVETGQGV